ncbi:uncharacterized protein LOC132042871 [Lycium ferocissimum]|uniref:uncharacterized protein LOC132042871 n=1 Tax=Lycium ferocissimum TaxID=112874 RepID=UPI0028168197|nr:uncharacterized protein LOC132042871 [Lycium ferocissimum]
MAALQHFNAGTVVEWKLKSKPGVVGNIFQFVFWAFKPCIDGFAHCRPVISIDGTYVYEVYDIKLLITVGMDANGSIFPLAFATAANESTETWGLFLTYLRQHVIKDRMGICVISDRNAGILSNMWDLHGWQPPFAHHRYCLRHLKANF